MLTKSMTRKIELPHEPGEWIEIRLLGYRSLAQSRDVKQLEQAKLLRELGSVLDRVQSSVPSETAVVTVPDPLLNYDINTLLEEAIVGWSYGEKVTKDAIHSLDETTARLIALEIIPKAAEDADTRKND